MCASKRRRFLSCFLQQYSFLGFWTFGDYSFLRTAYDKIACNTLIFKGRMYYDSISLQANDVDFHTYRGTSEN